LGPYSSIVPRQKMKQKQRKNKIEFGAFGQVRMIPKAEKTSFLIKKRIFLP
jgi:hypothetical protein